MRTHVLIIGAGLSGLHTAYECHKKSIDYFLLEARERLGGRILSAQAGHQNYDAKQAAFDLGPSWFWPGQQRMQSLIEELDLKSNIIPQSSIGTGIYEDNQGNIQRGVDGISMAGAYRLSAGIGQLVHALQQTLDSKRVLNNCAANQVSLKGNIINTQFDTASEVKEISSDYVVLAMPPRVALANIEFTPGFSNARIRQLNEIATWMAGHAKLVCVYENKFWQQQGYSGDVISHKGPLQEIHDASSEGGELNALFGFIGVAPANRLNREHEIKQLAIAQLTRLFGSEAAKPTNVYLQDWSAEQYTATQYDQQIQRFHAMNDIRHTQEAEWNNHLIWSGTESADYNSQNNGFLEGALESSMHTISLLS